MHAGSRAISLAVQNRCENKARKPSWKRCGCRGSLAKAAPDEADWKEQQDKPEKERQAEFKQDAKKERDRGEDRTNSLDKGISKLKDETHKIDLYRCAVIFQGDVMDRGRTRGKVPTAALKRS